VCHENPSFERRFGEDEGESGDVVEMETSRTSSVFLLSREGGPRTKRQDDEVAKQLEHETIIESKHRDGEVVNRFVLLVCSNSTMDWHAMPKG
jgi:hypothetical protein